MRNLKLIFKLVFFELSFLFCLFLHVNTASALDYTETFDNSAYNSAFWESTRGNLSYDHEDEHEFALMKVLNGVNPFFYFKSKQFSVLKSGYSSITLNLKFSSNSVLQGAGYILSDNVPSEAESLVFDNYLFYIWPKPSGTFHLFSSVCPSNNLNCNVNAQLSNGVYPMPVDGNWHELTVTRVNQHFEWYLDDVLIFSTVDVGRNITRIGVGDPEISSGFQIWPQLYIDFIGLDSITYHSSVFPHLSQRDEAWGSHEYDSASSWAGIDKSGIDRWGCALTSAAMILQNYGVKMVDGTDVDPLKLNDWLMDNNGYIAPGLLNWIAITRFAKESFDAHSSTKELEYVRSYSTEKMTYPSILGISGHFLVATKADTPNWRVNDPALLAGDTPLPMSTIIKSVNTFIPSNTDLSYLLFTTDSPLDATLTDATGSATPLILTGEYLSDDLGGINSPTVYTAMVAKPTSGRYQLNVDSGNDSPTNLNIYFYDTGANVDKHIVEISRGQSQYILRYDKNNSGNNSVQLPDTTAPSTPALTAPDNESIHNKKDLVLKWSTVSDPSEPIKYDYKINEISHITSSNEINISDLPDGRHTWSVRSCDSASNCSQWSNSWLFEIDTTPPSSYFSLPAQMSSWDGKVAGTATDSGSGIDKVELVITKPDLSTFTVVATETENWQYTITNLVVGKYTIVSKSTDNAGNVQVEEMKVTTTYTIPTNILPNPPTMVAAYDFGPFIISTWSPVKNAKKYNVYLGTNPNQLSKVNETKTLWWMSSRLSKGRYYLGIAAVDKNGNESKMSRIIKVDVKHYFWWH